MKKLKKCFIITMLAIASGLFCSSVFLAGCSGIDPNKEEWKRNDDGKTSITNTYQVVVIDSCEYIYIYQGTSSWGAHKGNCKFCAARAARNNK